MAAGTLLAVATLFAATCIVDMRVAFFAFLFLYPAFPKVIAIGVGSQGFALSLQRMMLYLLLMGYVVRVALRAPEVRRGLGVLSRHRRITVYLLGWMVFATFASVIREGVNGGVLAGLSNLFFFTFFVLLISATFLHDRKDVVTAASCVVAGLLANELYAVVEWTNGKPLLESDISISYATFQQSSAILQGRMRAGAYRVMGAFTNPLELAAFGTVVSPILLAAVKSSRVIAVRFGAVVALALAVVVVVWTGSRSGIIVLVLTGGFFLARGVFFQRNRFRRNLAIFGWTLAVALLLVFVRKWLVGFLLEQGNLLAYRSLLWRQAQVVMGIPMVAASPVFGYGVSRNVLGVVDLNNIDNYYLKTALESGVVGLAFLCGFLAESWRLVRKTARGNDTKGIDVVIWAIAAIVAVNIALMFVISIYHVYIYLYVAVASLMVLHEGKSDGHGRLRGREAPV